jgi:polyferredoxin
MTMTHPGLPLWWGISILMVMLVASLWLLFAAAPTHKTSRVVNVIHLPVIGTLLQRLIAQPWVLLSLKFLMVTFFLTVIVAGLIGTPIAERNFATLLTWNIWWAGLIFSIFFLGTAWCAICPWDALAQWLVRRRLWRRTEPNNSLNLRVPRYLNNTWPALLMFIGLTWLELGLGVTSNPQATALLALLMVVLATVSLAVFKRKAFCQHFCPIGRTIGAYSQLAAVELRPINTQSCADCKTLECYHGNEQIDPCPTSLVMGTLKQNSYCTSCGNCVQSCPKDNIAWRLRNPIIEARETARPRWDEAWFMLGLLALTAFHGLTMMPFWEQWIRSLARFLGDSGQLVWSFSLGLSASMLLVAVLYVASIALTRRLFAPSLDFKGCFSSFAFVALPLAFSYHMAHNFNHLIRESGGVLAVIMNPLGIGTQPLSMAEKHQRHMDMWLSAEVLYSLQAVLMMIGFVIALQIIRHRASAVWKHMTKQINPWHSRFIPILLFALLITGFHLWMLMQPMTMRM